MEQEIILCPTASKLLMGPIQLPMQWILGAHTPAVKQPECEADHEAPSNASVKNDEAIPPFPHMTSWC
jgi:hypothetical protein